jgi:hypothetical protein
MLQTDERSKSLPAKAKGKYLRNKTLFLEKVMNNQDKITVNPNTIKNMKDKLDNPFKMPKSNEEIFEMRDLLNKEVDFLKSLNKNKYKGKKLKPDHELSLYLTETKEEYFNQNYHNFIEKFKNFVNENERKSDEIESPTNELHSADDAKVLEIISENKKEEEKKESEEGKKHQLQKKIETLGGKKRDNVREYINKTREIVFMKYTIDMKKERAVRIKETYKNELESIKESIISMKEAKKMFEKEFYEKFEKYVKYLTHQKEKEKAEENNLSETKLKLETENKRLIAKIKKVEENKEKLEEYRDFLICVKEKKLKLPEKFFRRIHTQVQEDPNKENSDSKRGGQHNTTYITALLDSNRDSNKTKTKDKKNTSNYRDDVDLFKKYENSQIFGSMTELIDEIKKMQNDNVNKLSEFNEVANTLNEAQKNIYIMKENDKNNFTYIVKDIEIKENQLRELKERNRKLVEERNLISEGGKSETSKNKNSEKKNLMRKSVLLPSFKNKFHQPKLFARIFEVYKSARDANLNIIGDKMISVYADSTRDTLIEVERKMLTMLQQIERTLDILLEKQNYFRINKPKEFLQLNSILEDERKIKKTVEQKIMDQMRNEHKIKDIMDRDKKVQKLPRRILPQRYLPIERNKKEKKDNKNDKKDLTFEDLIYFG